KLRFPGDFRILPRGVETSLFRPARKQNRIVVEWNPAERPSIRTAIRSLDERPGWELYLLRTRPLSGRPTIPRRLRAAAHTRTVRDAAAGAAVLAPARVFVPAPDGSPGLRLEAAACGAEVGNGSTPDAVASYADVAGKLDALYQRLAARRRTRPSEPALA